MQSAAPSLELLQALPVAVIVLDGRGRIQAVNSAVVDLLGYDQTELVGGELAAICDVTDLGLTSAEELTRLPQGGKRIALQTKSGGAVSVLFSSTVSAGDERGDTPVVYCAAQAIGTALDMELTAAAKDFHGVYEQSTLGIYQTNVEGRFLSANRALAQLFGFDSPDELIGASDDMATDTYVDPERRAQFVHAVAEAPVASFESEIRVRGGGTRWVRETAHAVRGADGAPLYFEGTVDDITEHKQQHEELERSKAALEEVNRRLQDNQGQLLQSEKLAMVGQLAAGVAHEINNPVGFVLSNLNTLGEYEADLADLLALYEELVDLMAAGDQATVESKLQEIDSQKEEMDLEFVLEDLKNLVTESRDGAERVRNIVRDLRDFSHLDRKERMPADLNAGLESTLNIVWNELKYKAEVKREYGELPEVMCYPMELNQVFMNILVNASHAMEEKGTITLRTYCDEDAVCVAITDTGKGMSPEVQEQVFTPFFTTKDVGEGTGLGLSMCYNIVTEKHRGEILLESEEGKGTTFTIRIPLSEADDD